MHRRLPENAKIKRPIASGVMIVGRGEVVGSGKSGWKTEEDGFTGLAGKLLNSVWCTVVQNVGVTGMVVWEFYKFGPCG
nr:hypothetical protein [Tanacetum cinerariifolium]